jgi:hypothetical protein
MGLLGKSLVSGLAMGTAAGTDGFMSGEGVSDRVDRAKLPALVGSGVGLLAPGLGYLAGRGIRGIQTCSAAFQATARRQQIASLSP